MCSHSCNDCSQMWRDDFSEPAQRMLAELSPLCQRPFTIWLACNGNTCTLRTQAQKTPRHHFSNHNKFPGRQKGRRFNKNFPKNMKTVVSLCIKMKSACLCAFPGCLRARILYYTQYIPTRHTRCERVTCGDHSRRPQHSSLMGARSGIKFSLQPAQKARVFYWGEKKEPPLVHTHTLMWKEAFGCCWWSERSVLLPRHQVIYLSESGYLWLPGWLTQVLKSQTKVGRAKSFFASIKVDATYMATKIGLL